MRFDELDLEEAVLDGLDAMNFQDTTPVQELTIPVILEGKDIIACAQTGTGKTAAYVLPLINQLSKGNHPDNAVNAVIMAPTRELAQQIDQQIEGFTYFVPVSAVAVYGGTDGVAWEQQKRGMEMGADIVIATPGRLLSHLKLGTVDLSQVSYFVLDEADRMLDMGFYDDIMQVYKQLPPTCQTIMFSATMPPKAGSGPLPAPQSGAFWRREGRKFPVCPRRWSGCGRRGWDRLSCSPPTCSAAMSTGG